MRIRVTIDDMDPNIPMIQWRLSILLAILICIPASTLVIYVIPYIMQKLMPIIGKNSGIDAAYPFWLSGKRERSLNGKVMIGICEIAIIIVMKRANS